MAIPLVIERIDVGEREIDAVVRVSNPMMQRTSAVPGLADALVSVLPGLARHTCHNDSGRDMIRELRDTELAHCLEHVAAELLALSGSPRSLRAHTRWDFAADGYGVYHVCLEYDDDLAVLAALRAALAVMGWAAGDGTSRPDIAKTAEKIRQLRATPAR